MNWSQRRLRELALTRHYTRWRAARGETDKACAAWRRAAFGLIYNMENFSGTSGDSKPTSDGRQAMKAC
jgi:hypothetical protein